MRKRLQFFLEQREKHPELLEPFIHKSVEIPPFVKMGKNVTIHQNCVIGAEGFGYEKLDDGTWIHVPHIGGITIGDDVEIHAMTIIDRGTVGDTIIGDGTKIDKHCHIGHNSRIGRNCVICSGVLICGSVTIGDNVWISPHATVINKATIANNVFIGLHANVIKSVTREGVRVVGNPARELQEAIPWR